VTDEQKGDGAVTADDRGEPAIRSADSLPNVGPAVAFTGPTIAAGEKTSARVTPTAERGEDPDAYTRVAALFSG
jgi:hypothetical protein